jgi:DNA-binding transcriptional LysR family regulator
MTVNLKLLSVFLLVAEHSSFRKAAEDLDRSQSAVSTQIRQLEEQLGVTLFHRTTRRVTLSTEGEQLLGYVRQALADIEHGTQALLKAAEVQRGRVVFACSTIVGARLAPMLTAFIREFPRVIVHVRELSAAAMLDSIQAQEADFGIGPYVNRETDFHFRPVLRDEIWAAVPRSSAFHDREGISLTELSRMRMLMITRSAARALGEQYHTLEHLPMESTYDGTQAGTMLSLVEAGLGAAILPRLVIPIDSPLNFTALALDPPVSYEVCIVTLAGKTLSPVAEQFITVAESVLKTSAIYEPAGR